LQRFLIVIDSGFFSLLALRNDGCLIAGPDRRLEVYPSAVQQAGHTPGILWFASEAVNLGLQFRNELHPLLRKYVEQTAELAVRNVFSGGAIALLPVLTGFNQPI